METKRWIALAMMLMVGTPGTVVAKHLTRDVTEPETETVVTGHTVLSSNLLKAFERPTDFAAIAGLAVVLRRNECVVWFNGVTIFDGTLAGGSANNSYDPCGKIPKDFLIMATESGDCDPRRALQAEFVRDLSFDDPNGVSHPVAEIRYVCAGNETVEQAADDLGHLGNDTLGDNGSALDETTARFNLDRIFQEYVWVTLSHPTTIDPTLSTTSSPLDQVECGTAVSGDITYHNFCAYNFALIVDTCNDEPRPGDNPRGSGTLYGLSGTSRCTDGGGEEFAVDNNTTNDEFMEARFDDTGRNVLVHAFEPSTRDEIADGNSNPDDNPCNNPDNHREDKSVEDGNTCESTGEGETDYDPEEDHLTASVDLYVSTEYCYEDDNGDATGYTTVVGRIFCENYNLGTVLTPLVVNHPGCDDTHDAEPGDGLGPPNGTGPQPGGVGCWDPPQPPDDVPGQGGPRP